MSLKKIIDQINETILPDCIEDSKVYGLAQSVVRTRNDEEENSIELLPGIVEHAGDIRYVGLDDEYKLQIYHKLISITAGKKAGRGSTDDLYNIYNCCMIVFNDRNKTRLRADEVFLIIQSNFPDVIALAPYRTISAMIKNVILDDQGVFESEYKGTEFDLPAHQNLFQINYTIESTFSKACFDTCPEI